MHAARLFFAILVPLVASSTEAAESPRVTRSLDADWRFAQADPAGAEAPGFDDSAWRTVDVPHDWAIAGPFREDAPARGEGGFLPTGVAWYRHAIAAPESLRGKRVRVEFEGVMHNSAVYLNGQLLGRRSSGYVSFGYDLAPHLNYGEGAENVLAVRVDTQDQVASRWYTGSGIHRHVRLVVTEPLRIAPDGLWVTTPRISGGSADVAAHVEVANGAASHQETVVRLALFGPDGEQVATGEQALDLPAGETATARVEARLESPALWGLDTPSLYRAVATVLIDGEPVDQADARFGVRTAEFRSESGFWLNGDNVKLKGVCLHHDGGPVGAAVPRAVWADRFERLKALGVNAVRTAHNPPDPAFLDLCDEMGLAVMDEFFDCWTKGKRTHDYHRHFEEWAHRDLRDTIRRDRNHPSMVLYSVGNEIHDTPKPELAKRVLRGLVDVCHRTDPTRPVTQALFRPNVSGDYDNGLADLLDIIGTNYRDGELLQAWEDDPTRKIIGTEQPHERQNWLLCRDSPQHAGQFLWVGVDYLGESRRWPLTTFNTGLIDRIGVLQPRGAQRASWWSEEPVVGVYRRLGATEATPDDPGYEAVEWKRRRVLFADWTPREATPHQELVEVYSNCEEVELLLNGRSLGMQELPADARPRNWTVPYEPGELVAIGRDHGKILVRTSLKTAGPAAKLSLSCGEGPLTTGFDSVALVRAEVQDAAGVRSPRAEQRVTYEVEGPGEIVGVDNGWVIDTESFTSNNRRAFRGRCLAVVRATGPGTIRVTARAEGLEPETVEIEAE